MKRYSKKRQSIIDCLAATDTHPTAEWVYRALKPQYPDLSLGTVYRNLNELKDEGVIFSVAVVGDKEHFDARTNPHAHIICEKCGKIRDLPQISLPQNLLEAANETEDFTVSFVDLHYVGLCGKCAAEGKV